jgi:hypothetical protein
MMMNKLLVLMVLVLFSSAAGFGQSAFSGLTPGKSSKADVQRLLGQPLREVSETLHEYKSENPSEKIFVQFSLEASVVERIEAIYPATRDRAEVIRALRLPVLPTASQTNAKGKLEEYFASSGIVLTYASSEADGGVSRVGYYSSDLFNSAVANVPRTPQNNRTASAGKPSNDDMPEPRESSPGSNRSSNSTSGTSTQLSRKTIGIRPDASTNSTETIRPLDAPERSRSDAAPDSKALNRSLVISDELSEQLAGRYEFDSQDEPMLAKVIIDRTDGRLRWNAGSTTYFLIHSGTGQVSDADGKPEKDILQFRLEGKPDVKVQFILRRGRVERLTYIESNSTSMIYAVGFPKP